MRTLVYRENKLFKIDVQQLSERARTTSVINALYAAIYTEFIDAIYNTKYSQMTALEKMNAVNTFAAKWLKARGL